MWEETGVPGAENTRGRALTYSFHMSVMSEVLSEDRTQDSEVKGDCSDDCTTEAPKSVINK